MTISLTETLKEFVQRHVVECDMDTSSNYVSEPMRKEKDRQHVRSLLLAGASSGIGEVADKAYFDGLRQRALRAKLLEQISSSPQPTARSAG
jgi:antitoxin ParD1/3/4